MDFIEFLRICIFIGITHTYIRLILIGVAILIIGVFIYMIRRKKNGQKGNKQVHDHQQT